MPRTPWASRPLLVLATLSACCPTATPRPVPPPPAAPPPTAHAATSASPPLAPLRPVVHTYHGVEVVDPYEWLEASDDPEVRAWTAAQTAFARRALDALPEREALRDRVRAILAAPARSHRSVVVRGGKVFAIERKPPREQPFLVVLDSVDAPDSARTVIDPTAIDAGGGVSIDWFVPSPDGVLVAASLSRGGSERGDLHVFDVATGRQVHEVIEHVSAGTAGGALAWMPDGSGYFYTRYPRAGERPAEDLDFYQQVFFHAIGADVAGDRFVMGRDFPKVAQFRLRSDPRSGRLLITVQNGDGGPIGLWLRARDGRIQQLAAFGDGAVQASFGPRNDLYVVSRKDAPRGKILRLLLSRPELARAITVVPEGPDTITNDVWEGPTVVATRTRLLAIVQLGGPTELRAYDLDGRPQERPEQLGVAATEALVPADDRRVLFLQESFTRPAAWSELDTATGRVRTTALVDSSPVDASAWHVRREVATSVDGTPIPFNILSTAALPNDGSAPCIVSGYGGFAISIEPRFRPLVSLLLDRDVVYVTTNLRGGSEFGEAWHDAGRLTHKQNVFDDFAAVLRRLVELRVTSPDRLGIIGGSNGGLLMGATLTQHTELARAVVSFVGIYDMLRVERSTNGAFNVTEYGSVADPDQFRALHAYSPLHAVRDGTRYPATLLVTGENDPRVEPWHSRKFAARLQAASTAPSAILLRTSATSGHGLDTALSEEIEEWTDAYGFLLARLGVTAPR